MKKTLFFVFISAFSLCFGGAKAHKKPVRVYVDIAGDLFHSGHVEFLRKAKEHGDYLIVGVLSDDTIESYKRKPILSLEERVTAISGCKYVDEVIADCPLRLTHEDIKRMQIDVVVHGDDNPEMCQDHYKIPIELGIFKQVPYTKGISTTDIIGRVKSRFVK